MDGIVALHPALAAARTLRVVIAGHVDHGKSTLIGRLLHDTGALGPERVTAVEAMSKKRGMPFEWSFLIDALQAERDQGITIDTAEVQFRTPRRRYVIIDAPGHAEFLKNMVSGAAGADAALLLVDAREGTLEQSRRHALILGLLGITQVVVAINKMDLVGYDQARYQAVVDEISAYLGSVGITPSAVVPVAARHGENIATRSALMPWHDGPSLVEALDGLEAAPTPTDQPLRLPVQDVYKFDERRIVAGRIESGAPRGRPDAALRALGQGRAHRRDRELAGGRDHHGQGRPGGRADARPAGLRRARPDRDPGRRRRRRARPG